MARWFLLSILTLNLGRVSAEGFDAYIKDAQREKLFTQNGNDQLRAAVKEVEEQNQDKVVLYHAMPLNGYLMAWLAQALTAKESTEWQKTPGVSAELKFSLRHFEPGMSFPSFTLHKASLCDTPWCIRKVRDADPEQAKVLGDGEWSNNMDMPEDRKEWKVFEVAYDNHVEKVYHDCSALVYADLAEDNNKNGPLLEETALADAHVSTGKQFAEYLDAKVGEKWEDTPAYDGLGMSTVGVQDRLLDAQINLLGSSRIGFEQMNEEESMWKHFTSWKEAEFDLKSEQLGDSVNEGVADFGDRTPLLDQVLDPLKPSPATLQKVSNLLSLLRCTALMRFPARSEDFNHRTGIMSKCWSGDRAPFPPDLQKMNLDGVASKRTKAAATALQNGGLPTAEETRGFARVLLQVVLPTDVANDLAYVSTDWQPKFPRRRPPGTPEPWQRAGHEHEDWKDKSFMDAYKLLKNTAQGDKVTARLLLKRDWGLSPSDPESVKIIATSMAFADPEFMEFAASVLEDIRNCVLNPKTDDPKTDDSSPWPSWVLKVVVPVLCLGLLMGCLGYRRHHLRATTAAMTDVELPEHPLRA
ncbi:unnamed protein product [Symbiodinium sp. CCMP2456]|nr:unnamed protein product [Symbiodinium sp. CCMP2456]